jgi:membrane-associated phospholipid phosphatase
MWTAISNVGDAALTLPVALTCAIWLRLSDKRLAMRWMMLLAAGMALVGVTKILYAGCGVEISAIGFRVISGHTTLSTSVWTVAIALLWRSAGGNARAGALVGLLIGLLTAFARVFDYAHTVPEVIAGWLLGALIAALFVHPLAHSNVKLFRPLAAAAGLLLVTTVAYGRHAPIQAMIGHYSPGVCARIWASVSAVF